MRTEPQLQQHHRRGVSLSSAIANDRDDDLILFKDMQRKEQERKLSIPEDPGMQIPRTPLRASEQSLQKMPAPSLPIKSCGSDDILASDWDKTDYDWLMTPPSTPVFLMVDHDSVSNCLPRAGSTSVRLKPSKFGASKSEISSKAEPPSKSVRGNLGLQQPVNVKNSGSTTTLTLNSDSSMLRSRKSPTQNSNMAARPPTQSSIHMSRLTSTGANISSRVSTSHSGATTAPAFVSNRGAHTTTSSVQSAIPCGRSASSLRPSTPLKRSSPSHVCNPPSTLVRCSSANKASSVMSKLSTMSRASSPTTKAWSPDAFNGICQEPLPNLRTSMQEKSSCISKSNKTDHGECLHTNIQDRWKSGPLILTKEQTTTAGQTGGKKLPRNGGVDTSLAKTNGKMGEKAIGGKKHAVFSNEGQVSAVDTNVKKPAKGTLRDVKSIFSSVRESSGLGRNVPKKSSDLDSKHTDAAATRSTPYKLRSFMSSMAKSTLISKNSGSNGTYSASSISVSPMATSSSASSEHNMSIVIDPDGSELGDECVSERGSRSSAASQGDFLALGRERRINSWLQGPEYKDDDADIMQIFEQEGLESLSGPESPLVTELEGTIECDNFCLDPI